MAKKKIDIGRFTKEIVIGNYGTEIVECIPTKVWQEKVNCFGDVKPLSLRKTEVISAEGHVGFNCKEFIIRDEFGEISYSDIIRYNENDYNIIAIEPSEDDMFLYITGERVMS